MALAAGDLRLLALRILALVWEHAGALDVWGRDRERWGTRRFLELYFIGILGAAVTTVAFSYAHVLSDPTRATVGASGGVFAILLAFGILFADNEIMMFPFPFLIKAKYFIGILIVITLAFAMTGGGNVAYIAHLGGFSLDIFTSGAGRRRRWST